MFNASIMIWLSVGISLCLPIIHLTIVLLTFLVLLYPLGDYTMCPSWKGGNGLTDILVAGIIWPSYSALGTVFFFPSLRIRTKLRPCIDFRGLNKITARYNTHCLYCPLLLSCYRVVTQLFSANWISWWGLESGASGRQPTLWVGLGAVFQALVNDAVWDFMNHFVFVYLDDILIFSRFLQEYMSHVRQVQPSR